MFDPRSLSKLFFGSASELKEVGAEPNLFDVSLVTRFCDDLFDSILLLAFFVLSKPYKAEPSPT
jgi:hypothetical protein